jgi:hypothetical protein
MLFYNQPLEEKFNALIFQLVLANTKFNLPRMLLLRHAHGVKSFAGTGRIIKPN